jgi:hypothetical protein
MKCKHAADGSCKFGPRPFCDNGCFEPTDADRDEWDSHQPQAGRRIVRSPMKV